MYLSQHASPGADGLPIRELMDHLGLGFWDYDVASQTFFATRTWRRIRGMADDALVDVTDGVWLDDIHPDDRAALHETFERVHRNDEQSVNIQFRHRHADGRWIWLLCRARVLETDASGRAARIVGVDSEISDLKKREEEALALAAKLNLANEVAGIGIWEFDNATSTVHWNDRMLDIYGLSDGVNRRPGDFWEQNLHPDDREEMVRYAAECQRLETDFRRDFRILRRDGEVRFLRGLARQVCDGEGGLRLVGVNIDVTEDYRRTEELEAARRAVEHEARHDPLTGLGNRRHLDERVDAQFGSMTAGDSCAVLQIDLDRFKALNDTHGHAAGDEALRRVAHRITRLLPDGASAFRVGGDEFVVLAPGLCDRSQAAALCARLIDAVSLPFRFEGRDCATGASIGYVIQKGPPASRSDVFRAADTALYAAKDGGRSSFVTLDRATSRPR